MKKDNELAAVPHWRRHTRRRLPVDLQSILFRIKRFWRLCFAPRLRDGAASALSVAVANATTTYTVDRTIAERASC